MLTSLNFLYNSINKNAVKRNDKFLFARFMLKFNLMKNKYLNWIDKNIHKEQLKNKTVLITGGNSGIGLEVIKYCAYLKMNIILTVRSPSKGEKTVKEITSLYPKVDIRYLILDTSSIESINQFVNKIKDEKIDFDYFYSNAGTFNLPKELTKDGYERVIMTNFLGPFLLISKLDNYSLAFKHPLRIILTTSITAKHARICYEDFTTLSKTTKFNTYAESKLAIVHFYLYLCKLYKDSNVIPQLVHPGVTATPLIFKAYPKWFANIAVAFMKLMFHSPKKAALSTIALLDKDGSLFMGPRGINNMSGYPQENKINKHMKKNYKKTIEVSKELLKLD